MIPLAEEILKALVLQVGLPALLTLLEGHAANDVEKEAVRAALRTLADESAKAIIEG